MFTPHLHLHPKLCQMYDCVSSMQSQIEKWEKSTDNRSIYQVKLSGFSTDIRSAKTFLHWHLHLHNLCSSHPPLAPHSPLRTSLSTLRKWVTSLIHCLSTLTQLIAHLLYHWSSTTSTQFLQHYPNEENTPDFYPLRNHLSPLPSFPSIYTTLKMYFTIK